ncbi:MAG: hypothetical protein M3077_13655 [Candidatus Dormibacteraeota bacterium]|nr:hypothetical protein [Candidatus Dormibacteraeota bacterium]
MPRRSGAALCVGMALLLTSQTVIADSSSVAATASVDALWNQPQGTRVDSAFYVIQSWWDGLSRTGERNPHKRGLQELAQANEDLLNAYTLLQEQRDNPGPHPVAVIDPFLSSTYAFVTGVHVKAPIGSVFGWLNNAALHVEGRGSIDTIIKNLLRDYQTQDALARRDLASDDAAENAIVSANRLRQTAMIGRIAEVGPASANLFTSVASGPSAPLTPEASRPAAGANSKASANDKGKKAPGKSGDGHDRADAQKGRKP